MNKSKVLNVIKQIFLILIAIIILFPIIYTVFNTFKPSDELYSSSFSLLPKTWTLDNYRKAFKDNNFGIYNKNSLIVAIASTFITVIINSMAGFSLAKYKFKGANLILLIFISTLAIPLEVIMSPIFIVIRNLGLYNSLWGLIIPAAATPTGVFLMRQYFVSIPDELMEAARIDGSSEWGIYARIMLPLGKPVIAALAIFSFMWRWNDYIWPLIVINNPKKYTLQLAISNFAGQFSTDWDSLLAVSVISMVPVLVIFLIFQKYFMAGISTTGMKG